MVKEIKCKSCFGPFTQEQLTEYSYTTHSYHNKEYVVCEYCGASHKLDVKQLEKKENAFSKQMRQLGYYTSYTTGYRY